VLQCVAVWCSVMQCGAVLCRNPLRTRSHLGWCFGVCTCLRTRVYVYVGVGVGVGVGVCSRFELVCVRVRVRVSACD